METKFGTLEEAQKKLQELYNKDYSDNGKNNNDYWNRLTDYTSKFSQTQLEFVVKSEEVQRADKEMKDMFMLFLFEKYKSSFASIEAFQPVCNKYIDTVIKVGSDFDSYSKNIEEENAELKKKLAEYERKAEKDNANARQNPKRA